MPMTFSGAPFPPDPARLSTANTFLAAQSVAGTLSASGLIYDGTNNSSQWDTSFTTVQTNSSISWKAGETYQVDYNVYGFLNQTETALVYDGTNTFTLSSLGASWSYYRGGIKNTITGSKSVVLGSPVLSGIKYAIYIDNNIGALSAVDAAVAGWTLNDTKVPVATIYIDPTMTPTYFLAEERHTCLISRRDHMIEHFTGGTIFAGGGQLNGPTVQDSTDSSKTVGVSASQIFDEDIYMITNAIPKGTGTDAVYPVFYRSGSVWKWYKSDMPFKYTTTGAIEWDNNGNMEAASAGSGAAHRYVNYYLFLSNIVGDYSGVFIPGRGAFETPSEAHSEKFSSFDLGTLPCAEGIAIWQFTWSTLGANKGLCWLQRAPQRISENSISNTIVSGETSPYLANRLLVGDQGDYTSLKDAVDWFNYGATNSVEILLDSGYFPITDTITVSNTAYPLVIRGTGSGSTFLEASTGLTNKPILDLQSSCTIKSVQGVGSTLASYGTLSTENFLNISTNQGQYYEITDFIADGFYHGIVDTIGSDVFLFNYVIRNCTVGTEVYYAYSPSIVTLDCEVGNYESCNTGVSLLSGNNSNFILTHLVFLQSLPADKGLVYNGTGFSYQTVANIMNCSWNYIGELASGFDFSRQDGRDGGVVIQGNVGEEDKSPHGKFNVVDNATGVVCTTQSVYYKAVGMNSKLNVFCNAAATGGSFTLSIGGETTGAINYSATPATFASNIKAAVEALAAITTVTVTTVTNAKEWNIEFVTADQGFVSPFSATNSLTSVTTITVTPNFYVTKVKYGANKITSLGKKPYDGVLFISGNLSVNQNGDTTNIGIMKNNNGRIISPFSVRTTTSGQPYPFSLVVYLEDVALNDFFEIWVADITSAGKTVIISDLTVYFTAR